MTHGTCSTQELCYANGIHKPVVKGPKETQFEVGGRQHGRAQHDVILPKSNATCRVQHMIKATCAASAASLCAAATDVLPDSALRREYSRSKGPASRSDAPLSAAPRKLNTV